MLFDFLALDSTGKRLVAVEAKRLAPTSPDWARQFHRNLLAHGGLDAEWFVVVTPEHAYAFREDGDPDSLPEVVIDTRSRLQHYLKKLDTTAANVSPGTFEHVVAWWLEDLAMGRVKDKELQASGLASQLEGATIVRDAA